MDYQVELVARAFYDAKYEDCLWDGEAEFIKQEFREYARNAINLFHDDIGLEDRVPTFDPQARLKAMPDFNAHPAADPRSA
jgi:hypothetical protein